MTRATEIGGRDFCLPAAPVSLVFRRPLADLWLRPWFDWLGLRFVHRFYFPVSRAWARAADPDCREQDFREAFALTSRSCGGLSAALEAVADGRRAYEAAAWHWQSRLFGPEDVAPAELTQAEAARSLAAHRFMATRRLFGPWRRRLPAAHWDIAPPDHVEQRHGARRSMPGEAYPAPPNTEVLRSQSMPASRGTISWLSFVSPVLGDRVTARVHEPAEARADCPTLILLHGIAMEEEMWRPRPDPFDRLVAAGWRVIKPEGPWHGRRRPPGRYGGEPVIAQGVEGILTLFHAWVTESAVLLDWARNQGSRVALGGISLGALTAQLLASRARDWPARLTPDALLLIATSGCLRGAAYDGALARALGMPGRLAEAGWSEAHIDSWLSLIEPGESAVPPERTLLLLGRSDQVTPYDGGTSLAERWQVPPQNLFLRRQGHFSVSLGLAADPAPLQRLREVTETARV